MELTEQVVTTSKYGVLYQVRYGYPKSTDAYKYDPNVFSTVTQADERARDLQKQGYDVLVTKTKLLLYTEGI